MDIGVPLRELGAYGIGALVRFDGRTLKRSADLPRGLHNARPFGAGVLFNDIRNAIHGLEVWPFGGR
jgi:hypothetical protein